jgi:uncharacterized membrane protein
MKHPIILASAATILVLWLVRVAVTGSLRYDFIIWNIALASVPLLVEPAFTAIRNRITGILAKVASLLTAAVWLLFLPNAFYIITDFMHLNPDVVVNARDDAKTYSIFYDRGDGLYIYDTLLLFAAAAFGAYVGGLALLHAYTYFRKKVSRVLAIPLIAFIMLLAAVGVYIGRFGRWNSWDGLLYPHYVITDLIDSLMNSTTLERFSLLVLTIVLFQAGSLLLVYFQQKR